MDGYCSKGAALMRGGFKVTEEVHTPSDILIDLEIIRNAPRLMTVDTIRNMLIKTGCPVRFSERGVREETMEEMMEKACAIRDRYTILTLIHDLGLTEQVKPVLMKEFY